MVPPELPPQTDPDAVTQATPASSSLSMPPPESTVGGYRIVRALAAGGTAVVFDAVDVRLGRNVALKILQAHGVEQARERFLREVRLIAGLQHPNVVLLYGAGEDRGYTWAAMELMPTSLAQELQKCGRLSAQATALVGRDACRGLEAAWQRGIVHRDVKPSNLLRDASGTVKIADFGLAKDLSIELHLTAPDVILGTPLYVSPEQASGRASGHAADLYSLGATLYHLVSGKPPFHSTSALDVIVRHAVEPPPPLPPDVPAPLARLIMTLLEKDPARRPPDYGVVLEALEACLEEGAGEVDEPTFGPAAADRVDGVSASLLAAARGALELGRPKRARTLLDPLVRDRAPGWVQAGFMLATALEQSGEIADARQILENIAADARVTDDRALALWSLGRLAEQESAAALARAVESYRRITDVSTARFPKALLEARIERLRKQIASRRVDKSDASGGSR
jgi:hypothetical protein